jgi:hypothetical protein
VTLTWCRPDRETPSTTGRSGGAVADSQPLIEQEKQMNRTTISATFLALGLAVGCAKDPVGQDGGDQELFTRASADRGSDH